MCGVLGIYGFGDVVGDLYNGLLSIQHRGQDAAGIVTYSDKFHLRKGFGLVQMVFNDRIIPRLKGPIGIGHVRYPTVGGGQVEDAQPMYVNSPYGIAMVHNGNLTNFKELKRELFEENLRHIDSNCDVEAILNVFADELMKKKSKKLLENNVFSAVEGVYKRCFGSYSVVALIAGRGMVAFRDPYGIKPLVFGRKKTPQGYAYIFSSETVTLDMLGYEFVRDVQRGEAVYIDKDRKIHSKIILQKQHCPCIFEYVYFARPDSIIDGISVYKARLRLGKNLAREWKKTKYPSDVVIPVPDSAKSAALALSESIDVKYRDGLIKSRYIGRTFIMPNQMQRRTSVRHKLNPMPLEINKKRVLVVDDSIVRGTTSKEIIQMIRDVGARKVYYVSASPPLKYQCVYGIDMQTKGEFVAKDHNVEQIRKIIGADALVYQTMQGMIDACSYGNVKTFCTACFSGKYPTPEVTQKKLREIEQERTCSRC